MSLEIRLFKLICGDMVMAKHDTDNNRITDVALLQTIPTQQGMQMVILPYGYPFENDFGSAISLDHVMYQYKSFPEELKKKYMEASSNITISTESDLHSLGLSSGNRDVGPGQVDFSKLFNK